MPKAKVINWGGESKIKDIPFARIIDEDTIEIKVKDKRLLITGSDFAILGSESRYKNEVSVIVEEGKLVEDGLTISEKELKDNEELDENGEAIESKQPGEEDNEELDENGKPINNGNPDDDDTPEGKRKPRPDGNNPDSTDDKRTFSRRLTPRQKIEKIRNDAGAINPEE